ncbi:hypothetical protein [Streptomyces microflavus]|uniref:hypothetical protein n=1 Tax=Streptomyces microflavus TaxID=1919 RepID=UPI003F4CEEA3
MFRTVVCACSGTPIRYTQPLMQYCAVLAEPHAGSKAHPANPTADGDQLPADETAST